MPLTREDIQALAAELAPALIDEVARQVEQRIRDAENLTLSQCMAEFGGSSKTWYDWLRTGAIAHTLTPKGRVLVTRAEARRVWARRYKRFKGEEKVIM